MYNVLMYIAMFPVTSHSGYVGLFISVVVVDMSKNEVNVYKQQTSL